MALYVELDATATNGEQYWYDQYTEGEPLIAALKSETTSSSVTGLTGLQYSSGVFPGTSTVLAGYERLQSTAGLVQATAVVINNANYNSSSGVVQFPESETEVHPNVTLYPRGSLIVSGSTVYVSGRLKWENLDENSETWTNISKNSETWTEVN